MLCFPHAKINIGLNILNKRPDGFHNIETIFYPIGLSDVLEFIEAPDNSKQPIFTNSGLLIDAPEEKNLCVKAYRLLQTDFNLPDIQIHLHKIIPFGAGLGGGSSDAAFMLKILNGYFNLKLSETRLIEYASKLGSDCAFFIYGKPCLATGRGEILTPIHLDLSDYSILLVKPNTHISTVEAYSGVTPSIPENSLHELIKLPISNWKNYIKNDFEEHLFETYPELKNIKAELYNLGALYAAMSGSGSSIYGIFKSLPYIDNKFKDCYIYKNKL
jgi:4-diphosphocytidyl-2-C-methyl-D-erythritol kinase